LRFLQEAKTDLVFLVDIDFVPSSELALLASGGSVIEESYRKEYAKYLTLCKCGAVLVVPAFAMDDNQTNVPRTQRDLAPLWKQEIVKQFAAGFPQGHRRTDFSRWFGSGAPYMIENERGFEPYIIALRTGLPLYDERFRGYGLNKISHLYEIERKGAVFIVLPGMFIIARKHPKSSSALRWIRTNRDAAPTSQRLRRQFWYEVDQRWGTGNNRSNATRACIARANLL
jgi:glycosyltransferase-like protein LARGE